MTLANYRFTPAYRDLYRETDLNLIRKMLRPDVWSYWSVAGRLDDNYNLTGGVGFLDPVADENIMYSGHLLQMVTTHEMLYGDERFDEPGSIDFKYLGQSKASYDTHRSSPISAVNSLTGCG